MSGYSLLALTADYHETIDALFVLHQECLLEHAIPQAKLVLTHFEEALHAHLDAENRWLIPCYESLQGNKRWPASLYRKEHDKLLQMLEKVHLYLDLVAGKTSRHYRLAMLDLLDYERSFRHVLEHHEEREELAMLKDLDERLAAEGLRELHEQCRQSWAPFSIDALAEQLGEVQNHLT